MVTLYRMTHVSRHSAR